MPIYEYQCTKCEHALEALQKISDDPLKDCPECGKPSLNKLVSAASFRLKGGGWYETDFKTGNKKQLADSDSSASGSGSSTSAKSETSDKSSNSTSTKSESKTKSDAKNSAKTAKKESAKPSSS